MKNMVPNSLPSGMDNSMEWSHASLDHVGRCSSRKQAVECSPSSQPSVNSELVASKINDTEIF
jgi:hypothetical protein